MTAPARALLRIIVHGVAQDALTLSGIAGSPLGEPVRRSLLRLNYGNA
jgi:hypothetical protein